MIRFRRLPLPLLDAWLASCPVPSGSRQYRLRLWHEDRAALAGILQGLVPYLEEVFADARRRLRRGFADDLSPFKGPHRDPAANYPELLHRVTLQGYLGEVIGGLAVEHWGAHGYQDWAVPAFLFRYHTVEFQHLERINERIMAGELKGSWYMLTCTVLGVFEAIELTSGINCQAYSGPHGVPDAVDFGAEFASDHASAFMTG